MAKIGFSLVSVWLTITKLRNLTDFRTSVQLETVISAMGYLPSTLRGSPWHKIRHHVEIVMLECLNVDKLIGQHPNALMLDNCAFLP